MRHNFHNGLPGLQIDWKDNLELEYFGKKMLMGQADYTAAQCKVGGNTYQYRYPVNVSLEGTTLTVEYQEVPKSWPKSWDIYKGILTIRLGSLESLEPHAIEWLIRGESKPYLLQRGEDWVFTEFNDADTVDFLARGRVTASRQMRPEQKAMRNRLISMYGGCQITGVKAVEAIEACHIIPVKNGGDDSLPNLLLLRRDLHSLFDSGLLRLTEENSAWKVVMDDNVTDETYRALHGRKLPADELKIHASHLKAREKREPLKG